MTGKTQSNDVVLTVQYMKAEIESLKTTQTEIKPFYLSLCIITPQTVLHSGSFLLVHRSLLILHESVGLWVVKVQRTQFLHSGFICVQF